MNGILLYQSKYGASKKYAGWLAEETGFPCIETKQAKISDVQSYDAVILGGGIYASGIAGLSFLKKNIHALQGREILVFGVGASLYDEKVLQTVAAHNMTERLSGIPCFYCRGAWDMASMTAVDRTLCKLLKKAVAKKDPNEYEAWEQALMEAGNEKRDWTDRKYLQPILEKLKK